MYWSPNFLAVAFKKQEISQQVFSSIFRRYTPNTQRGLWPGAGCKRPGVGTQTLVTLNFSAVVAPLAIQCESQKSSPHLKLFAIFSLRLSIFPWNFANLLPVYKAKAKANDSYIVILTGKPDQTRFTIIEVELIGKSQWCCSAKWGRPLQVLANNWTRTSRSKQSCSEHTPPQSTTTGMVAVKNFSHSHLVVALSK